MKFFLWYSLAGFVLGFLYLIPTFRKKRPEENTAAYIWRRREHAQMLATAGIFCPVLWPLAIIYFLCTRKTNCPVCGRHNTVMFSRSHRHGTSEENWFSCSECGYTDSAHATVPEIKPDKHNNHTNRGHGSGGSGGSGSWGGGGSFGGGAGRKF